MKRYEIKVEEVKTTVFALNANNKKEAEAMVKDIIYKTCILDLKCVDHYKEYFLNIKRIKRGTKR